ncbi:M67 family metallopeptidase [Thermococcus atlanticus]
MMLMLKNEHLNEILKRAEESPVEICGLLFGKKKGTCAFVEEIKFIKNRLDSPYAFEMEPLEMIRAIDEAEERGLEVVGIFHSHLCKPIPSERDRKGMENWPVIWLIVDNGGNYGAFMLERGSIKEVVVVTE